MINRVTRGRAFAAVAAFGVASMVLAACGGSSTSTESSAAPAASAASAAPADSAAPAEGGQPVAVDGAGHPGACFTAGIVDVDCQKEWLVAKS